MCCVYTSTFETQVVYGNFSWQSPQDERNNNEKVYTEDCYASQQSTQEQSSRLTFFLAEVKSDDEVAGLLAEKYFRHQIEHHQQ